MRRRLIVSAISLVAVVMAATAVGATTSATKVIELTCQKCEPLGKNNPFSQSRYDVAQAFNKKYAGKYHINIQHWGASGEGDVQYWKRLALAHKLPDIFVESSNLLKDLQQSSALLNLAPFLANDKAWKSSFLAGSFRSLTTSKGQIVGIPETRDTIGIFWNKALFQKARIANGFPTTWAEFLADCAKLKAAGVIPIALDGDWTTLLIWADLIGTQPGGAQFLYSGITKGNYASNPIVVKATQFLKRVHTSGYANSDAFTGDYQNAATPFLQRQAAMIANGPWMVAGDIKGPNAAPGLYSQVGYAPAPGWKASGQGAIVIAGGSGWAAAATKDPGRQKAITAFLKFTTQPNIQFQRTLKTGSFWPVNLKVSKQRIAKLEPLAYRLSTRSAGLKYQFVHAKASSPQAFTDEWKNDWPAYVKGSMNTTEFLDKLSKAGRKAG